MLSDPHLSCLERAASDREATPEMAARLRLMIAARTGVGYPASNEEEEVHGGSGLAG